MRKTATILLVIAGLCWFGAAPGRAQSPIGLYGQWSSSMAPGVGGQMKLTDISVTPDGAFVGRIFFTGSPCALWANFSGRVYGDSATMSMYVGACGLVEVTLNRVGGSAWAGSYRTSNSDAGMVQMVQ